MATAKPTTRRKTVLTLAAIVLVLGAIAYGIVHWLRQEQGKQELTLHGNVDIRQVDLGFRVGGRIGEMRFEEGDRVKAGDVAAALEKAPYQHELAAAKAQVAQAQADFTKMRHGSRPQEIEQARASVREQQAAFDNAHKFAVRQKSLVDSHSVSRQDYENAAAAEKEARARLQTAQEALRLQQEGFRKEDIAAALAALDTAKARFATAQTNLEDTQIVAPSDGTIFTRVHEPGSIVAAGTTVYTLALQNPIWIRAYVDEPDLGRLKPGMEAQVLTDTYPGQPIKGKVGFISPQAEFTPKTIETKELRTDLVYRLRILVSDPEGKLRQGEPVTVTIHTERQ